MVGVQYKGKIGYFRVMVKGIGEKIKKLHRRESNPGRKRERLECYQLHHNGFLIYGFEDVHQETVHRKGEVKKKRRYEIML